MIAIDSRKCAATNQGLSLVSTVIPPSTAWAGMLAASSTASRTCRRPSTAATRVASTTRLTRKVSCRLVNSMIPWIA